MKNIANNTPLEIVTQKSVGSVRTFNIEVPIIVVFIIGRVYQQAPNATIADKGILKIFINVNKIHLKVFIVFSFLPYLSYFCIINLAIL